MKKYCLNCKAAFYNLDMSEIEKYMQHELLYPSEKSIIRCMAVTFTHEINQAMTAPNYNHQPANRGPSNECQQFFTKPQ